MPLDPSKPHGFHLGGKLHGCTGQDGKNYRPDGTEVDLDNKPVKPPKQGGGTVITPPPAKKAADPNAEQLAAQLAG